MCIRDRVGSVLGKKVNVFGKALAALDAHDTVTKLENGEKVVVNLDGEDFEFGEEYVLINISAKEGFNVSMQNNVFVLLETELNEELVNEGFAREFISKVQQLRKAANFEVLDNIVIDYCSDDEVAKAVAEFEDYIKSETLAVELNRVEAVSYTHLDVYKRQLQEGYYEEGMRIRYR